MFKRFVGDRLHQRGQLESSWSTSRYGLKAAAIDRQLYVSKVDIYIYIYVSTKADLKMFDTNGSVLVNAPNQVLGG